VQGHLIPLIALVYRLHYVDLAIIRPVGWIREPKSWPGPAGVRCVPDVEDKQSRIVPLLGFQTNRTSPF
jgi:hypothetical protein